MNLYKKNLLFRSHPRGLVHATAGSLVLIGRMWTTCRPKPYSSPPPHPLFVSSPCQGQQESWGEKGRSSCRPSPASYALTAFSHGSDPSYMPVAAVISDGSPFYRENAPVGVPRAGDDPASRTTELLRGGGGCQGEE